MLSVNVTFRPLLNITMWGILWESYKGSTLLEKGHFLEEKCQVMDDGNARLMQSVGAETSLWYTIINISISISCSSHGVRPCVFFA